MWDEKAQTVTETVLAYLDEALAEKVYKKIWSELRPVDRAFLEFIAKEDKMDVAELLELSGKKHNEWSEPRRRLKDKGIIDVSERGKISNRLPRLMEFIDFITAF